MPDTLHKPQTITPTSIHQADVALKQFLQNRQQDLSLRSLEVNDHLIDFASNDYLGLSRSAWLRRQVAIELDTHYRYHPEGAGGSRLISGNHEIYEKLESRIAQHHLAEAALLFNSGYDANVGFFSSVPQHGDTILADELVHASIRDGIKLTRANSNYFLHNDLIDLESKIRSATGNVFVAVESIYSMDGDFAPLQQLAQLVHKYGIHLVVDEAHASGLFGPLGAGRVVELGLQNTVYARVITYGKALGSHGAAVVGSVTLKHFLINFARSFIFSTAIPLSAVIRLHKVYDILSNGFNKWNYISDLCALLKAELKVLPTATLMEGNSQIKSLIVPGNDRAKQVSIALKEAGVYAKAILYPTVPRGKERLRICVHAHNTQAEIMLLTNTIKTALQ